VNRWILGTSLALACLVSGLTAFAPDERGDERVVIGYVFPRGRILGPSEVDATKLTHVNYAFANVVHGEIVEGSPQDGENLRVLGELRRTNRGFKVLVSVGGWTWSKGFSDAVLTPESRQRFVASAVEFVRRHALDGVDIDWEYPALPGDSNPHRPEDTANFTTVMADLRRALDREASTSGRRLLLTMAAGAFPAFLDHTDMRNVQRSVDFVNLMTYDFRVQSSDPIAGHHANLRPHPDDDKQLSVVRAVSDFSEAGVPHGKLVVGVPFYSRGWEDVAPDRNGLYQVGRPLSTMPDTTPPGVDALLASGDGWARQWDAVAEAPYLWNTRKHIFISIEDAESLRAKTAFVLKEDLAGIMFWEYFADPSGRLLQAVVDGLQGRK
jgi:chitinase